MCARLLEVGRADRAEEELRLDGAAADRALRLLPGDPGFERAQLHLPGQHLREGLRRPEQEVDEWADERHEAEQGRSPDEPRIVDPASGVPVRPVGEAEPEEDDEEERDVPRDRERGRVVDVVERPEGRHEDGA